MNSLSNYRYVNCLGYDEIASIEYNPNYRIDLINDAKRNLFEQIINDPENQVEPWNAAFRFQVDILDGMNIVAKCEEIPTDIVAVKIPCKESIPLPMYRRLTFKERLKVLFKGGI